MRARRQSLRLLTALLTLCVGTDVVTSQELGPVSIVEVATTAPSDAVLESRASVSRGTQGTAPLTTPRREVAATEGPADEGVTERAILARLDAFDLHAHVPPFWSQPSFARRPLEPLRQRRRLPARCRTTGGYREHCSGPRLLAPVTGAPAALAEHIGLGLDATAMRLMGPAGPFDVWRDAARGLDADRHLTHPVPSGRNGRGFGYTRTGSLRGVRHDGIDIQAARGSPIVAARGGLVAYADNGLTGMGNLLIVLHDDGDSTAYAHCQRILVQPGEVVDRGEVVAEVGMTGFAGAPHLHFEWRENGRNRDPRRMLLRRP